MDDVSGGLPATVGSGRSEGRDPVWFYAAIPWLFGVDAVAGLFDAHRVPAHTLLGLAGEALLAAFVLAFPPVLVRAFVRRARRA
jgi:hypothetical protein